MRLEALEFRRILLIKPSSLGDIIHALPVLNGLRRRYPEAHITWLVNAEYAPLLSGHPQLDALIHFQRQQLKSLRGLLRFLADLPGFVRRLRQPGFDLVIDLQGLLRSGLMARTTGSSTRVGFAAAREGASLFYTHCFVTPPDCVHAVDKNYEVARVLGFTDVPVQFVLPVDAHARLQMQERLAGLSGTGRRVAVVLPSSRWETKNWPAASYAAVIGQLRAAGFEAVLAGAPADFETCEQVAAACDPPPLNLCGQTTLPQMVALIHLAAVVLCGDSAPAHMAAALGTPLVSVFGPTDPRRTGPYGPHHQILQAALGCSPCYLRKLSQCRHVHACMSEITPGAVSAAMLSAAHPRQG